MITPSAALRASLPAVVNPSRQILVTSALNNRPVSRRLGIGYVQPADRESKKLRPFATGCNLLQKPLPLFSSTYSLFFAKQGGRGVHDKFLLTQNEAPKRKRAPNRLGGGDP